jgi:hypothetical protein
MIPAGDNWLRRWDEFVLWLLGPFSRCGSDDRCPFIPAAFATFNAEDKLWKVVVDDGYATPIYVYYCPWCGRRLIEEPK